MSQSSTAHWSIGEVLALLQDEFPEVTISKIRFLESQGLIDPERTPSGYRRFYETDFDRLRWILVQQRDHYLPLKVIRDRLDAGEEIGVPSGDDIAIISNGDPATSGEESTDSQPPVLDLTDVAARAGHIEMAADEVEAVQVVPAAESDPSVDAEPHVDAAPHVDVEAESLSLDAVFDQVAAELAPDEPTETVAASPPDKPIVGDDDAAVLDHFFEGTATDASAVESGADEGVIADNPDPAKAEPEKVEPHQTDSESTDSESTDSEKVTNVEPATPAVALTRDELAEASGCGPAMLHDLERFNLITGRSVGSSVVFDADAVVVASVAHRFNEFGLEPRHLRAIRLSSEREVGLIAQIVEPMLHRRDPKAAVESQATLAELTGLTAELREALVRQLVNELLPGASS